MSMLAIHGGQKVRKKPFPAYKVIGEDEKQAVMDVLDSGILSRYLGCWHADFYGGPQVQSLEKEWAEHFGVKHAVAVNSCTSGLYCAVGAVGTAPGDEIIVSPYSMSCSATAPLVYGAVPVFADIEEDYYCLDPDSVESKITERTRAILVVDIFGQPYNADRINSIAKKHNLMVIEDCAQAPNARYKNKYAGTLGDIGVHSLNYHKHIHCGEGGMIVTDNDDLADKVRLIRNHAEAVVEAKGNTDLTNMVGFNYRMTEMEAAVARCQLKKLNQLVAKRQENCRYLNDRFAEIDAVEPTRIRDNCTHSYYVQPLKFNEEIVSVPRNIFIDAVKAELPTTELREKEGVLISCGYVKPLYLQPIFQNQIAYGRHGFPFKGPHYGGAVNYSKGICPTTERMYEKELFFHDLMHTSFSKTDLDDVITAFMKVWENRKELISEPMLA